jgi:adenylate cyclase class IV
MIEIEKKFLLSDTQQQALLEGAHELGEKMVEDSYLDTEDFRLTKQDYWFRERNGAYELKAPLKSSDSSPTVTNRYHELTSIEEICQELQIDTGVDFETALSAAGITRFITCYTSRKSYEKDGFHIDIDAATYEDSDFVYALAEIELLVSDESHADEAERRIVEFAKSFNLTTDQLVLGKIGSYLKSENPAHYGALVSAGVFK